MAIPVPRDWLMNQLKVMRAADRDVLRILEQSRKDLARMIAEIEKRPGVGAEARRTQLLLMKRNIQLEQARLLKAIGKVVEARRLEAAARVLDVDALLDRLKLIAAGVPGGADVAKAIAAAELESARSAMDRLMARVSNASYVPLSERVYNTTVLVNERVDRMVNSALSRGLSAREFALEARQYINPNTPGGLRYASMRLARTEINNAAHAVAIATVQDKPWVDSMQWHLSGSHPKPDICDQLAKGGPNGDGKYPKTDVPGKPHPHCFCYVTPVTPEDDEFLDALMGGAYNSYLEQYSPGISQRLSGLVGSNPVGPKAVPPLVNPAEAAKKAAAAEKARQARVLKNKARDHTAKANGVSADIFGQTAAKRKVQAELEHQAGLTPKAMLRLERVIGEPEGTQFGDDFLHKNGDSCGAYYTYTGYDRNIVLSPKAISKPSEFDKLWEQSEASGWTTPSDFTGTRSTIAHEYGHHLDSMISNHSGNFSAAVADQLFPILIKELRLNDPKGIFKPGKGVFWRDFDALVAENEALLKQIVSKYAATNARELLAEIWAEYSGRGKNARPYIKKIGRLIQRLAEESS
jgi:hypothetical protein